MSISITKTKEHTSTLAEVFLSCSLGTAPMAEEEVGREPPEVRCSRMPASVVQSQQSVDVLLMGAHIKAAGYSSTPNTGIINTWKRELTKH